MEKTEDQRKEPIVSGLLSVPPFFPVASKGEEKASKPLLTKFEPIHKREMQRHAFGEKRGGREHTFSHFSPACTPLFFPHKQHKAKKERHKSLPLCRGAASFPGIIPKHGSTDNGSRVLSSSSLWDYITRTLDLAPFFLPHLVFTLGVLFSLTIRGASFALI